MRNLVIGILMTIAATSGFSQVTLDYYLEEADFLPGIPAPESVVGHPIGEWHLSHDKLVYYLTELAEASDRVVIEEYARSHENRPRKR